MKKAVSEADVIWQNSSCFCVRCPFCEGVHRHGINWKAGSATYLCCFPIIDQDEVMYGMDKKRGRYVNICISTSSDTENDNDGDVDQLATDLAESTAITAVGKETCLDIMEDAIEVVTVNFGDGIEPFEQKTIVHAIGDCIAGNTGALRIYLETSSEAQLFVRGRFPFNGETTLICAASRHTPEMLSLLIEYGADVDAVDIRGRSALMEAALFGQVENIKVLLKCGADTKIRDVNTRQAVCFAQDHQEVREERYDRTDVRIRLLCRETQDLDTTFGKPPTLSLSRSCRSTSSSMGNSVIHDPIEEHPITRSEKTVARLERGGGFPSVITTSVWSQDPVQFLTVESRQWTDYVFYIAETVGHHLPSHLNDQGKQGQYNACHAEKQLIAYFIDCHVFLPRDRLSGLNLKEEIKMAEDELEKIYSHTEIGREMTHLWRKKNDLNGDFLSKVLFRNYDEALNLISKLGAVEETLNCLLSSPRAQSLQELECRLKMLRRQRDRLNDITNMVEAPPSLASLSEAAILLSSAPCDDCRAFTDKVNKHFGLSIQLFAAV
ncbi:hypothetical protein ASPBRDRAFT_55733 [Aspergillus brasiliensis CBS 101740]|uniref:Single-strand DNA deaminase toxin A-like C-terminal domain-containing protein n=1 Tax=Aspergillus brasiliensis (strain CBS 101740 / IMI 381727 / IBT 21946) TaxID=767769 RepID=A0A1L9UHD5_ASPBC|nr:hypothetical protein ASPBRDRAFT_55733 [Aspergillus brasiliensis CBS 101740]